MKRWRYDFAQRLQIETWVIRDEMKLLPTKYRSTLTIIGGVSDKLGAGTGRGKDGPSETLTHLNRPGQPTLLLNRSAVLRHAILRRSRRRRDALGLE